MIGSIDDWSQIMIGPFRDFVRKQQMKIDSKRVQRYQRTQSETEKLRTETET